MGAIVGAIHRNDICLHLYNATLNHHRGDALDNYLLSYDPANEDSQALTVIAELNQ